MAKKIIEVFNRYENKYMLNSETFFALQEKLLERMEPDSYNKNGSTYSITNIYYDTDDNYLIRTSLSKPKYKEKLRIRAYGTPKTDSKIYVEIKKKVNGIVNKRRTSMKLGEAYDFLSTSKISNYEPYMNKQVIKEIQYMLSQRELKPKLYLSYDREAFFEKGNADLRVSFDKNIQTRRYDLNLESGSYGTQLIDSDTYIMEVKSEKSIPIWLARLLSEYKIYPTSFSKYGTEYKQSVVLGAKYSKSANGILVPAI